MTGAATNGIRPRVLVLASTYPRWRGDHEPGFVHELSKRMVGPFDVTAICPHSPGALVDEVMDGVRVVRFRYAPESWETLVNDGGMIANLRRNRLKWLLLPGFFLGQLVATWRVLRRFDPHVIHAHWIIPQGLLPAMLGVAGFKVPPFVVTSHGADLYALRSSLMRRLKRFVVRRAAEVAVVSSSMREEVLRLGGASEKVSVQSMGVDLTERFVDDPAVPRNPSQILFVGRLVAKKGLRHLIDAMSLVVAKSPDVRLDIVGFGPEEASLRCQVRDLGLERSIRFIGSVGHADLPALYRQAAVFVAPFVVTPDGDQEGLGLVLVEAAGCGCRLVAGDVAAVRDVINDPAIGTLVDPSDSEALADAILGAISDASNEGLDQGPARSSAVARFDWTQRAKAYELLLQKRRRQD